MLASSEPSPSSQSVERTQSAIQSLSQILGPFPIDHLSSSETPALALLHDPTVASLVSRHLRRPTSGAGDDGLCRWLYDTFQSTDPSLELIVLSFLPLLAALYLSRCCTARRRHHQPLAGFEAVLLALYAHETLSRAGNPISVSLPNLSVPSPYHEPRPPSTSKNGTTANSNKTADQEPVIAATAVISPALEPHGTVRSTKRARIVGVALELYYTRILHMPAESKLQFCRFARAWAGQYDHSASNQIIEETLSRALSNSIEDKEASKEIEGTQSISNSDHKLKEEEESKETDHDKHEEEEEVSIEETHSALKPDELSKEEEEERRDFRGERIPLPWELFHPTLRIVGHCLLAPSSGEELKVAAAAAAKGLHERAIHDMNTQAAMATRSLMRLGTMPPDTITEPSVPSVYSKASELETA